MNRIYQSAWNDKAGTFVAVSETAIRAGKQSSPGASAKVGAVAGNARFALKALATSVMLAFCASVFALPVGGVVAQGGASISGAPGSTTITQTSQNVAINWQSFSIGATEAVQFVQPNSSSVALNRVQGPDPSSILGSMSANGKVFLVNPNGVLFGRGAQVNVGGLVASTLNISDGDFMASNYQFSGNSGAAVLNKGTININAPGGYVALLGANVGNDGTIVARLGTVALAAGNAMTLDVAGDGLLNVTVSQGAVNALIENGGLIQADGGQVLLTAKSAGNLLLSAVNNTGVIQAQSIVNRNGTITLLGDMQSGTMNISGTLDVSGTAAGQTGGNVTVTGHHVGLFGANINASGDAGGGTVLIGGGYQGKNPAVQNASATYMSADSTINADAISNGNGGTVVLWADDSTRARGSITARGGAQGGDGGLIETSAHWLDVVGIKVNTGAPNGNAGTWLLDPANVTIDAVTANEDQAGGVFTPSSGVAAASVSVADIILALAGGNVTINTVNNGVSGGGAGNITVAATLPFPTTNTLTLNAEGNITVNLGANITGTGGGDLAMKAGGNVDLRSAITLTDGNLVVCCGSNIDVSGAITTTRGSILLSARNDVRISGAVTVTERGNLTVCAGHDINVSGKITLDNGTVDPLISLGLERGLVLSAGNAATGPGAAGGGGSVFLPPAGDVLRPTVTAAPTNITYNPVSYSAAVIDYAPNIIGSAPVVRRMVFPEAPDRDFVAGSKAVPVFTSFKPDLNGLRPANITLAGAGTANFADPAVGDNKIVTFSGFTLAGPDRLLYKLPGDVLPLPIDPARLDCCGGGSGRTTANIKPLPFIPPPDNTEVLPGIKVDIPIELVEVIAAPGFVMSDEMFLARGPEWIPTVVDTRTPPQLLSIAPPPVPVVVPPPRVEEVPPPVYVPPVLPPKQDRN